MKDQKVWHITYERATDVGGTKGEVTERYVVPFHVPPDYVRTLDVTSLTEEERTEWAALIEEYNEYYSTALSTIFSFNDWMEQSHADVDINDAKWRTLKMEKIKLLD